jgi:single-strand DNA-binding protein
MYNKVILVGRLTRDIELRYLPSGSAVATFSLATSRSWKDKNSGETKEETMFIDIKTFGRSAEIANQYLKKGNRVLVEGRLVLERWTDQNGGNRSKHVIQADSVNFMETRAEANNSANYSSNDDDESYGYQPEPKVEPYKPSASTQPKPAQIPEIDIDDDEIPF